MRSSEFSRVSPLVLRSVGAELPPETTCSTSYPRDGTFLTPTSRRYVRVDEFLESSWKGRVLPKASSTASPALGEAGNCTSKVAKSVRDQAKGLTTIIGTPLDALPVLTCDEMALSALVVASSVVQRTTS